jgi:hypothetical protein
VNLLDASVAYFRTTPTLPSRPSKRALLAILNRHRSTPARDRSDALDLFLPSFVDYDSLSFAALKALAALYVWCHRKHVDFVVALTRVELSALANVSHPRYLNAALDELEQAGLVRAVRTRRVVTITLLEQQSRKSLCELAAEIRAEFESKDLFHWYDKMLTGGRNLIRRPVPSQDNFFSESVTYVGGCPFCPTGFTSKTRKQFRLKICLKDGVWHEQYRCWRCHFVRRTNVERMTRARAQTIKTPCFQLWLRLRMRMNEATVHVGVPALSERQQEWAAWEGKRI